MSENCLWFASSFGLCQCLVGCFGSILPFSKDFFLAVLFLNIFQHCYSVLVSLTKIHA